MKKKSYHFKKGDLLAIGIVAFGIVLSAAFVKFELLSSASGQFASIYQDEQLVRKIPLSVNQTFEIHGVYTNTITVCDGKIAVTHSDCPSHDCVHQGWRSNGAIICLPNHVEIRITSDDNIDIVLH